jgi:hypothetical protein
VSSSCQLHGTYTFNITVDARNVPVGQVRHAVVVFTEINGCRVRFPITIVRGEPDIRMDKQCNPATLALRGTTDCTHLDHQHHLPERFCDAERYNAAPVEGW